MRRTFSRQCPHCTRQVTWPETSTYPFCSERCRLIDLGLWASGEYRIPGEALAEEERWPAADVPEGEGVDVLPPLKWRDSSESASTSSP